MLQSLILFPCLVLSLSLHPSAEDNVGYGLCEDSPQQLHVEYLDIYPYPLAFLCGGECNTIYVRALIDLLVPIPVGATVSFEFVKPGIIPIKIPCMDWEGWGPVGSCTYDAEEFLSKFAGYLCPDGPCLPILPGKYGDIEESISVTFQEFPYIVCDFFPLGDVTMEFSIRDAADTELTCMNMTPCSEGGCLRHNRWPS